jgi:hypothetical protein
MSSAAREDAADQPVLHQPADAPQPRLVGIAADVGREGADQPAGRSLVHIEVEVEDEIGNLLYRPGHRQLGARRCGEIRLAAVAPVERRPPVDLCGHGGEVDRNITAVGGGQSPQLLAHQHQPPRLVGARPRSLPLIAGIDELEGKDRGPGPGGGRRRGDKE